MKKKVTTVKKRATKSVYQEVIPMPVLMDEERDYHKKKQFTQADIDKAKAEAKLPDTPWDKMQELRHQLTEQNEHIAQLKEALELSEKRREVLRASLATVAEKVRAETSLLV